MARSLWDYFPKSQDPVMGDDYDLDPSLSQALWSGPSPQLDQYRDSPIQSPALIPGLANPVDLASNIAGGAAGSKLASGIADAAGAMGNAAKSALDYLPQVLGDETGAIQLKPGITFNRFKQVTAGENPLDHDPKSWGKYVQGLGPNLRDKNAEMIGSQMVDQFQTTNPKELSDRFLGSKGIPTSRLPEVTTGEIDPNTIASYSPFDNRITLNRSTWDRVSQHQEDRIFGDLGHEDLHARQFLSDPRSQGNLMDQLNAALESRPEALLPGLSKTNDALNRAGMFEPYRIEFLLRQSQQDPALASRLPDWVVQMMTQRGASPRQLAPVLANNSEFRNSMGNIIRQSIGNRGFRGMDPLLADSIQSLGHFDPSLPSEMLAPVKQLTQQQAERGGEVGAWENVWPNMVKKARDDYQSNAVPVQSAQGEAVHLSGRDMPQAAINPWAAMGVLAGSPAAALGLANGIPNGVSQPVKEGSGEQKTDQEDQGVLSPSASDEESSYPTNAILKMLLKDHGRGYRRAR